jgi:hydrogenase-4 component E
MIEILYYEKLIIALIIGTVLFALSTHRLFPLVKTIAIQSFLVSLLTIVLEGGEIAIYGLIIALSTLVIRSFFIPSFLIYATRKGNIKRELNPLIGYRASLFFGLTVIAIAYIFSGYLDFDISKKLLFIGGTTTIIPALFLLMARKKAITQVSSYLMLENGISIVGLMIGKNMQYVVEFGILLDILICVMLMTIIINQIGKLYTPEDYKKE